MRYLTYVQKPGGKFLLVGVSDNPESARKVGKRHSKDYPVCVVTDSYTGKVVYESLKS